MSHQLAVSLKKSLCLSHPGSYTQQVKSNQKKKIPKDSALGRGSAPISFSLGWLPAESNKGLCSAALLQTSVVKAQWEGAPTCETHAAENAFINHTDSLLIRVANKQKVHDKKKNISARAICGCQNHEQKSVLNPIACGLPGDVQ